MAGKEYLPVAELLQLHDAFKNAHSFCSVASCVGGAQSLCLVVNRLQGNLQLPTLLALQLTMAHGQCFATWWPQALGKCCKYCAFGNDSQIPMICAKTSMDTAQFHVCDKFEPIF